MVDGVTRRVDWPTTRLSVCRPPGSAVDVVLFDDLWDAPGGALEELNYPSEGKQPRRSINLELYTTNLAHGRPYRFPLEPQDDMGRLFFSLDQLEDYFPRPVLQHLMACSVPYAPQSRFDPPPGRHSENLRELPGKDLPIVVAARLALSFPGLISAVPLWAMDYEPSKMERGLRQCWFSDGGLCSNFPIHLFDSFVPRWPTFGIALHRRSEYRAGPVWLPDKHYQGGGDTWDRGLDEKRPAFQRLGNFLLSLWMATWRWNDMTMMRMPGVRDRVVRVLLNEDEGGVNIKMRPEQILALARNYGRKAAQEFVKKFAAPGSPGWPEHRWVRFNRLLIAVREQIEGIGFAAGLSRYTVPLREQIDAAIQEPPLRGHRETPQPSETPISPDQQQELKRLLAMLSEVEQTVDEAGHHRPFNAIPRPSLRVRHPT
jgi:hypothetical protein